MEDLKQNITMQKPKNPYQKTKSDYSIGVFDGWQECAKVYEKYIEERDEWLMNELKKLAQFCIKTEQSTPHGYMIASDKIIAKLDSLHMSLITKLKTDKE